MSPSAQQKTRVQPTDYPTECIPYVKITLFTIASLTSVRINTMLVRVNGLESHIRKTQADKQTKMHEQTHA